MWFDFNSKARLSCTQNDAATPSFGAATLFWVITTELVVGRLFGKRVRVVKGPQWPFHFTWVST